MLAALTTHFVSAAQAILHRGAGSALRSSMLAIANIPREVTRRRHGRAFVSLCVAMISFMALFGLEL
ncbi:MAG: hypothetical protein M5U12_28315 [Verrucomicrobia bacterium]|nr:hypothetical protein [Verrucomicrobiota bacterium]